MSKERPECFYGNPLVGVWVVPSTGQRIFPSKLSESHPEWVKDEEIIKRQTDRGREPYFKYWPWIKDEKLQYDEEA